MNTLAFSLGPIQFDQPIWLVLVGICWLLALWIGRQSLSGLGTTTRRIALGIRLLVILLLVATLAKPSWRKESKNVTVTVILDASESVPKPLQEGARKFLEDAAAFAHPGDKQAQVTAARDAYVQVLPTAPRDKPDTIHTGATDGTNLAEAGRLGMAISPAETANRLLYISDFNETAGDIRGLAETAKSRGVPIDVLPLRYRYENEVVVERLVAPPTARMGQNVNLRVLITSQKPTTGKLSILVDGQPLMLGSDRSTAQPIKLDAGSNAHTIPVTLPDAKPYEFEAVFEPDNPESDAIAQNNRQMAVTFVQGEGKVLIVSQTTEEVAPISRALREARIAAEVVTPDAMPTTMAKLGAYDAIVLSNIRSDLISPERQEELKSYIHDLGGGLMMLGGPESFGAGGWIGSPLADALPIKLDPPQKRQMPRGALALIMHSCEMPNGNYWGKKTGESAINNLSRLDLCGILEYSYSSSNPWVHPLQEVGNKASLMRAINSLTYGDMQSFDPILQEAYNKLKLVDAGLKHVILISDGDPSLQNQGLLTQFKQAKISISTVLVYPHNRAASGPDWVQMREIALQTGGRPYSIIDEGEFAKLPNIFIKEAQVVRRSLIWEGSPFTPTVVNAVAEPMRGVSGVPPIEGYVVAADREGLSIVTLRGKENDPILAMWQFGLGRSVTFTTDAGARWAKAWPSWGKYRAFWEQHIRWMMRPGGSADMRVVTEDLGDKTRVVIDALDATGDRLNFVRFTARVVGPGNSSELLEMRQVGPGRYEGAFDSSRSGSYVANFRYMTPPLPTDPPGSPSRDGNIQVAVSRPFADEYRTLEDRAALGKVIADMTGGRVIDPDPKKADLWSRDKLTMPVATTPIWLLVTIIALGVFLADVAIRRVRIDPAMIAGFIRKGMKKGASAANQQMGSLKDARERARAGIEQKRTVTPEQRAAMAAQAKADTATSRAKFEVGADELARSKKNEAVPTLDPQRPKAAPPSTQPGATQDKPADGGLSRLMKAKQRAREGMDEEEKKS